MKKSRGCYKIEFLMAFYLCLIYFSFGCQSQETTNDSDPPNKTFWEIVGPGGGGSTFTPTFSYNSPDNFLIKCDMTGSYLTINGGDSYSQVNFNNGASAFAYDPKDSNTIYIGSTFLNRSIDGGKTWQKIFPREKDIKQSEYRGDHATFRIETVDSSLYNNRYQEINTIRIDPVVEGSIYISMGPLFFYSTDSGRTWRKIHLDQNIKYLYTNRNTVKDDVCIFTTNTIYFFNKSTEKISRQSIPKELTPANSFTAGTLKNSNKAIFYALHQNPDAGIADEPGYNEVWVSEDAGNSWKQVNDPVIVNSGTNAKPVYSRISCSESDAGQAYLVCSRYVEENGQNTKYWYGALKTQNAGVDWKWVWKGGGGSGRYGVKDGRDAPNLKDAWVQKAFGGEYIRLIDVGVYPLNGNFAVLTDWYRTMKTVDGGKTWSQIYSNALGDDTFITNGMNVTTSYGVHFDPFDSSHVAISYTDIGYHHSFNGGKSWTRSVEGVPAEWVNTCYWMVFDPVVKGKIWSVWSGMHDFPRGKMTRDPEWREKAQGGVCVSIDGGRTWKSIIEGMGFNSPATSIVLDMQSAPGKRTLYATVFNKGVFKSIDDGLTWKLMNNGIGDNTCAFELTLAENGNLFLVVSPTPMHKNGQKGRGFYSGAVYKSVDGADTWKQLDVTDGLLFPNGIEIDPHNPNRIYLACWSDIDISDLIGGDVARLSGGNKTLNIPGGIFLSENGGNTWEPLFDKKQYVYDVTADPVHPGRIYCNTYTGAAYRSDDYGNNWMKIKDYDFHWGHRVIIDRNNSEKVYLTTFGSSVWHGFPKVE